MLILILYIYVLSIRLAQTYHMPKINRFHFTLVQLNRAVLCSEYKFLN